MEQSTINKLIIIVGSVIFFIASSGVLYNAIVEVIFWKQIFGLGLAVFGYGLIIFIALKYSKAKS